MAIKAINKKLLVIGGASQHCKVVEAAHELGIKVYVVDNLETAPAKEIADVSKLIDINDIDGLVALCKEEQIDGAIATSLDACQIPYQKLCERMGFPCFGSKDQFHILTNKNAFKEFCQEHAVDVIPAYSIRDIVEDRTVEYPVFVKPVDSRGSRGQSICKNKEEVFAALQYAKQFASDGNVVIEKYMGDCQDFTVSYLCNNGIISVVRTGDRFEGTSGSGLENLCIASCSPSKFTEQYLETVNNTVVSMIRDLGIKNGPVFFQGFIDNGKVRFYDPGLRFAGGEYERILRQITGIDIIKTLVEFAVSGKINTVLDNNELCYLNGKKIIQLDPTLSPGTVMQIDGLDEIRNIPDVLYVSQRVFVGDTITKTNDLRQRFGEICILSENESRLIEVVLKVQSLLKILDENGESMIYEPFNIKRLL